MKKVYICSSCREENYNYVTDLLIKNKLLENIFVFRPVPQQLKEKIKYAKIDIEAINQCDEVWLIGDFGRDCSWEIGYAQGIGKPITVFQCEVNANKLFEDWMMHPLGYELKLLNNNTKVI